MLSSFLYGCGGLFSNKEIVVEYKTLYREIPSEYLEIPDEIPDLNYNDPLLTDEDIGLWLTEKDSRETVIEERMNSIIQFNNESKKLNDQLQEK